MRIRVKWDFRGSIELCSVPLISIDPVSAEADFGSSRKCSGSSMLSGLKSGADRLNADRFSTGFERASLCSGMSGCSVARPSSAVSSASWRRSLEVPAEVGSSRI